MFSIINNYIETDNLLRNSINDTNTSLTETNTIITNILQDNIEMSNRITNVINGDFDRLPILSFSNNYQYLKDSICTVSFDGLGTGTGWLYRKKNSDDKTIYVVTAAHCVVKRNNSGTDIFYDPLILVSNVNGSGNDHIFGTKAISVDKKGDIALLEILNHRGENNKFPVNWPNHKTLEIADAIPSIGSSVMIIGYSGGVDYNSFAYGYIRENNLQKNDTPTSLFYNFSAYSGNSGSPVLNLDNKVVGMFQWSLTETGLGGGIRGDILSYFLESAIQTFNNSDNTSYYNFFKKNYIGIVGPESNFLPLTGLMIHQLNQNYAGFEYLNGGRPITGMMLLYGEGGYTFYVMERITYIDRSNISKTITLSSSIDDKSSIWEVIYFAKPSSTITIYFRNLYPDNRGPDISENYVLSEMPNSIDYFLTKGYINNQVQVHVQSKEDIINNTNKILEILNCQLV